MIDSTATLSRSTMDARTIGLLADILTALKERDESPEGLFDIPAHQRHRAGDIEIDEVYRIVTVAGEEVALSPKEYDLLVALARRKGAPVSKATLFEEVWNQKVQSGSRTLDQHIHELRRKLERNPDAPKRIVTHWKFGYSLR